jgi:hypothetical protein
VDFRFQEPVGVLLFDDAQVNLQQRVDIDQRVEDL